MRRRLPTLLVLEVFRPDAGPDVRPVRERLLTGGAEYSKPYRFRRIIQSALAAANIACTCGVLNISPTRA